MQEKEKLSAECRAYTVLFHTDRGKRHRRWVAASGLGGCLIGAGSTAATWSLVRTLGARGVANVASCVGGGPRGERGHPREARERWRRGAHCNEVGGA